MPRWAGRATTARRRSRRGGLALATASLVVLSSTASIGLVKQGAWTDADGLFPLAASTAAPRLTVLLPPLPETPRPDAPVRSTGARGKERQLPTGHDAAVPPQQPVESRRGAAAVQGSFAERGGATGPAPATGTRPQPVDQAPPAAPDGTDAATPPDGALVGGVGSGAGTEMPAPQMPSPPRKADVKGKGPFDRLSERQARGKYQGNPVTDTMLDPAPAPAAPDPSAPLEGPAGDACPIDEVPVDGLVDDAAVPDQPPFDPVALPDVPDVPSDQDAATEQTTTTLHIEDAPGLIANGAVAVGCPVSEPPPAPVPPEPEPEPTPEPESSPEPSPSTDQPAEPHTTDGPATLSGTTEANERPPSAEVAEPAEPAHPAEPAEAAEPTETTQTTEPTEPTEPTETTQPAGPTGAPGDPEPVPATAPADSSDSAVDSAVESSGPVDSGTDPLPPDEGAAPPAPAPAAPAS